MMEGWVTLLPDETISRKVNVSQLATMQQTKTTETSPTLFILPYLNFAAGRRARGTAVDIRARRSTLAVSLQVQHRTAVCQRMPAMNANS
jgi:hypothetical protein